MRKTALALLLSSSYLGAQSRIELLQRVAEHYKNANTFAVKGTATAPIAGTSWRVSYDYNTEGAQPAFLPLDVRKPIPRVITVVANVKLTRADPTATDPKPPSNFAMVPLGQATEIATHLTDAQKTGEETVTIQGHAYPCELIEADYDDSPEFKPKSHVEHKRLWIAPEELLVLRETKSAPGGMEWTGEVRSFSFDEAPSPHMVEALQRAASQPTDRSDWVGRAVPDLTLQQLSGGPIKLSSLRGRPILLDFWGSYCAPCRRTTLYAQDLEARYKSSGLAVLTLTEDAPADAKLWTDHYHVTLPVLLDADGTAFKAFDVRGVPVTILVDSVGKIAHYWVGLDDPATMESEVKEKAAAVR